MVFVPYLVIIPLAAAFIIPVAGSRIKPIASTIAGLAALALAAVSLKLASIVMSEGVIVYKVGGHLPPAGIPMVIDALAAFMLVIANTVAFLALAYSAGYVKKYTDTWKFYTLFMLMVAGMNGVIAAGDLFNMYVFLEIAAISGYFLVAFGTGAEELEAAFKYAVMGAVASIFILLGIAVLYGYTSTLNMAGMAVSLAAGRTSGPVLFVSVLFIMGFGLKAALVPFHSWLAYAHSSAPAPVSAMLSGVSIKVLGAYALTRIFFNVFGMTSAVSAVLITMGVISMVSGAFLAFGQSDIKRLFAYSSISQIGYIAVALGVGTPLSILGGLFYIFNHSVAKALLFLNSGFIEKLTGTRDLRRMSGIMKRSPATGCATLAGAFSVAGVPPFGGFWAKLVIIFACLQAGRPALALAAALVSMLTLAYYFKGLSPALFREDGAAIPKTGNTISAGAVLVTTLMAAITLFSALMLLENPAGAILKGAASAVSAGTGYASSTLGALK
jgi:multicomponent Na+:H+ antiporter subunit D